MEELRVVEARRHVKARRLRIGYNPNEQWVCRDCEPTYQKDGLLLFTPDVVGYKTRCLDCGEMLGETNADGVAEWVKA